MNVPGIIIVASVAGWAAIVRWLGAQDRSIGRALDGPPVEYKPREDVHARVQFKTAA